MTFQPARTRRSMPNEEPDEKTRVEEVVEVALTKILPRRRKIP